MDNGSNYSGMGLRIMRDGYGRVIDYLHISVTDRCNFRCRYCMPPEGINLIESSGILSYEELLRVITILGQHGISKIGLTVSGSRLTGKLNLVY